MRRRLAAFLLVLLLLAVAAASLWLPSKRFTSETLVEIPRGTGSWKSARLLAGAGVIRYRWQFLVIRALRPRAKLQAGEYLFREPASPWRIFDRMVLGDVFYYELVVPEGQNVFGIAESLDRLGVIGGKQFLRAAADPTLIRDLAPAAQSLEGFLFPNTYRIAKSTSAEDLCLQMTEQFRQAWSSLHTDQPVLPVVTLASLVEKETAVAAERPVVASVFCNRLRIGMPLACDPTTIYAALLDGRYRGEIYRSDLDSRNRYNTYQHAGLPPGPIANAGLESLKAALDPAGTHYLYFVAKPGGSGSHVFSERLEAHQRAVALYRRANHKTDKEVAPVPIPGRKPARSAR